MGDRQRGMDALQKLYRVIQSIGPPDPVTNTPTRLCYMARESRLYLVRVT